MHHNNNPREKILRALGIPVTNGIILGHNQQRHIPKMALLPAPSAEKRCSYEKCRNPELSSRFRLVDEFCSAGGQNWKPLAGSLLCNTCYSRFVEWGTLERTITKNRPLADKEKKCMYSRCESPHANCRFYQIDGKSSAGGQDWSSLSGSVLCHLCYCRYKQRGTLERSRRTHKPLDESAKRCSYYGCDNPCKSRQFYQINGSSNAGGREWGNLAGRVLCQLCYNQFLSKGTLERMTRSTQSSPYQLAATPFPPASSHQSSPLPVLCFGQKKCAHEGCQNLFGTSKMTEIGEGCTVGGQDWSALKGKTLCQACYDRFRIRGTLEMRAQNSGTTVLDSLSHYVSPDTTHASLMYNLLLPNLPEGVSSGRRGSIEAGAGHDRLVLPGVALLGLGEMSHPGSAGSSESPLFQHAVGLSPACQITSSSNQGLLEALIFSNFGYEKCQTRPTCSETMCVDVKLSDGGGKQVDTPVEKKAKKHSSSQALDAVLTRAGSSGKRTSSSGTITRTGSIGKRTSSSGGFTGTESAKKKRPWVDDD